MRLKSSRRAVSEIVSALLVVMITIAAATLLGAYVSGVMGGILRPSSSGEPYTEQLALDYYTWPTPVTNGPTITIRNDGAATVTLIDFFIQGVKITNPSSSSGCPSGNPPYVLQVQSTCTITIPATTVSVTSGVSFVIKLAANDGTVFTFSCIAGSSTH